MAAHHTSKIRTHSRHTVRRYLAAIPWRCTRSTTSSCGACLSPCVLPSKARRDAGSDPRVASSVSQCALATRARISNLRSCRADNSMLKPKASLHIESDLLLTSFLCFAARLLAASAAACSRTRAEVDAALKNRNILEAAQSPAQALCTALRAGSIEQLTARAGQSKNCTKATTIITAGLVFTCQRSETVAFTLLSVPPALPTVLWYFNIHKTD